MAGDAGIIEEVEGINIGDFVWLFFLSFPVDLFYVLRLFFRWLFVPDMHLIRSLLTLCRVDEMEDESLLHFLLFCTASPTRTGDISRDILSTLHAHSIPTRRLEGIAGWRELVYGNNFVYFHYFTSTFVHGLYL